MWLLPLATLGSVMQEAGILDCKVPKASKKKGYLLKPVVGDRLSQTYTIKKSMYCRWLSISFNVKHRFWIGSSFQIRRSEWKVLRKIKELVQFRHQLK